MMFGDQDVTMTVLALVYTVYIVQNTVLAYGRGHTRVRRVRLKRGLGDTLQSGDGPCRCGQAVLLRVRLGCAHCPFAILWMEKRSHHRQANGGLLGP